MDETPRLRYLRMDPRFLENFTTAQGVWFETPADIALGLRWGRNKRALLCWVRAAMFLWLTARERYCIEQHFFEARTYQDIAMESGTHASSVCRAAQRGIRKLRQAAAADQGWQARYGPARPLQTVRLRNPRA